MHDVTTNQRATAIKMAGYISLKEACKFFPGHKRQSLCLQAIYRRTTKGCRGVKLRTVQLGIVRCTREEWIEEFIEKLTEKAGTKDTDPIRVNSTRQQEVERELDAIGI